MKNKSINPHSRSLILIAPLPPPIHGFSLIMSRLATYLERPQGFSGWTVMRCNVASSRRCALLKHVSQVRRNGLALIKILFNRSASHVVIGVNGGWGGWYTLLHVLACRFANKRAILHHHSYGYINSKKVVMQLVSWALHFDRGAHVFLSDAHMDDFVNVYPASLRGNAFSVSNLPFLELKPNRQPVEMGRGAIIRVGFLSNLCAAKGILEFLRLAERLATKSEDLEFFVAGPFSEKGIAADVSRLEHAGLLSYLGPVYGEEKSAFFDSLDLFVFPTNYLNEAQPVVIYEALASGVPVVSYLKGCIRDQLDTGITAVDSGFENLLSAVTRAIEDIRGLKCDSGRRLDIKKSLVAMLKKKERESVATLRELYG